MGNSISQKQFQGSTGKVILSDGSVHELNKGDGDVTVAELMLEHPQQVVVELRSAVSEKRATPLPADMKLDKKKIYLMLPMRRSGKPLSLSSQQIHGVVLTSAAKSVLRSRSPSSLLSSSSGFLPLLARICSAGDAQAFVLPNKEYYGMEGTSGSKVIMRYEPPAEEFLPENLDERPQYLTRQLSGKANWKPSLDTIKEKKVDKKVSHWYVILKDWPKKK